MRKILFFACTFLILSTHVSAQMWDGVDTLYGNEWITDFDKTYYKTMVAQDGIYRIPFSSLPPELAIVPASHLRMYSFGQEIPIFTSNDFIEFYGIQNRGELDTYLYSDAQDPFNPHYSLFTDSSAYFLMGGDTPSVYRYESILNDTTNLPEKEPYFFNTWVRRFTGSAIKKKIPGGSNRTEHSHFEDAEGYCYDNFNSIKVLVPFVYDSLGDSVQMTVRYAHTKADNSSPATKQIRVNGVAYHTRQFSLFEGAIASFNIPVSLLNDSITVQITGSKTAVSAIEVVYPRLFDAHAQSTFQFTLEADPFNTKYVEIENFLHDEEAPILFDRTNKLRITTSLENGVVRIALPPSESTRQLVLVNPVSGIKTTSPLEPVSFIDYENVDAEFLLIYNQVLAVDGNGVNQVEAYKDYRVNSPYNSYNTEVFEIQQLYDQFAYGINRHPMSIRNLTFYAIENWTDPQYLLLVGKGREYQDIRKTNQLAVANHTSFFLPTYGRPGGDPLFASPVGHVDPVMAVGRLPVRNANEIKYYLEKVQGFEAAPFVGNQTIEDKAWMKRIIHLGGGRDEQPIIQSHLEGMAHTISTNKFGGIVKSFYNTSTDPVVTSATGEIIDLINEGISILTFFGHSGSTLIDFNFDEPDSYDNEGKYPVMFSFGCYSGEMFNHNPGMGERFIFSEKNGAIAFISSAGVGFVSSLNVFGAGFYQRLGGELYGQSAGNILRETTFHLNNSGFEGDQVLAEQVSIQGDPSLAINPRPGPDYLTDPESIELQPSLLTTSLDSFQLSFDLWNIGQHLPDSNLVLKIEHELPNDALYTLMTDTIPVPASLQSLTYSLPILDDDEALVGINRFLITVDADDRIEENPLEAENNNEYIGPDGLIGHPVYISSADAQPLYPPNFGIVSSIPVELNASTGDPFSPEFIYRIEIDTTERFNSPLKQSTEITQSGGIIKWTPTINYQPNSVYYWRISPDSLVTGSSRWSTSSFVYLPNSSPGWNQSHLYQYHYDNFVDMKLPEDTRRLAFIDDVVDFKIRNNARNLSLKNPRYFRNQEDFYPVPSHMEYWGQISAGLFIAVIDSVNLKPVALSPSGVDWTPGNKKSFIFKTNDSIQRAQVINFLENGIPDGHYVLLFSCQNGVSADYKPQEWDNDTINGGTSLFQVLEAQGATQVHNLATLGSRPYNLFYRKNRQSVFPTSDIIGDFQTLTELNVSVPGSWTEGSLTSVPIGPAKEWESLEWEFSGINPDKDEMKLSVWGLPASSGPDTLLFDDALKANSTFSLKQIDAAQFPHIKLEYYAKDPSQKTPPHLEYWRVHYVGVPEAALDPHTHYSLQSDTLLQGAPLILEIGTENLSDNEMDSLLVRYSILDPQNEETTIEKRFRPLPARDTLITHFEYDTRPSVGVHQLTIDVNPDEDQPEQTHINNVGILQFYVESDQRNPLLDVTFDGMHILDGDLVSAQPMIQVQLKDENPYLALEDTSLFRLLLVKPGGLEERLYFTDERVRFFPAEISNGKNNRARVAFSPSFVEDGLYALYVEAADATGNKTGDINHVVSLTTFGYDYKISFKVITESMLSNVLNYPNPFSTRTRFLYTLTGSEPPAYFTIQILTVSGRVVREITQQEIGPMRMGTHLTDYAWDGRDEFGDPLANGVYLYRIVAKKANGENFKAYTSGADVFFNKGYGKMVLIR